MRYLNKRQNELLQLIRDNDSMRVNDIIPMLHVSAATVRKDLTFLQESGYVIRSRGEVQYLKKSLTTPFESRQNINAKSKQVIAHLAVNQINEGDTIILDSGTTTVEIAKLLTGFSNISIITNSLPAAMILATSKVNVYMAGGVLFQQNISTQGPEADCYFQNISVSKAFISATGTRGLTGLTASTPFEESIKRSMIKAADTIYAVVDHSKFSKNSLNLFAEYTDLDYIITDSIPEDPSLLEYWNEIGLECISP